ncbi:hypothetical protein VRRI112168_06150 [Vreelandella rituensis]|uniref:Uncharacterized protein n=1 Tax=Vreelandella rituensis TaxID=2282306 RepID=A0A368U6K6_9GAMM|nr:hypothetical protein [Halomonas rituensis]RCV92584.1 hypothetical protein DU506_06895 [Halomonas rituensis]
MKYQKAHKVLDERDKLRRFRELDDAFGEALRQLDDPNNSFNIPTGPPVRSLQSLEDDDKQLEVENLQVQREAQFQQRLEALMSEYQQSEESVKQLLDTLIRFGLWK